MDPDNFDPLIAHIDFDGHVFQVLNETATDWDEAATAAALEAYLASKAGA